MCSCAAETIRQSLRYKSEPNRFFVQTPENYEVGELNLEPTTDSTFIITHVGVDNSYNGLGIAKELVRQTVEAARQNHWKLIPRCPLQRPNTTSIPNIKTPWPDNLAASASQQRLFSVRAQNKKTACHFDW